MDVADGLANIEYNALFFLFLNNILLGTTTTFIFLNGFQGNVVSVTLTWCNKASVASTDHVEVLYFQ